MNTPQPCQFFTTAIGSRQSEIIASGVESLTLREALSRFDTIMVEGLKTICRADDYTGYYVRLEVDGKEVKMMAHPTYCSYLGYRPPLACRAELNRAQHQRTDTTHYENRR